MTLWLSCQKHRAWKPETQAKESHDLPSLALFEVALFGSREATAAFSLGL